ncbi:Ras family protein, partial [Ancylostoma ceylanicum]
LGESEAKRLKLRRSAGKSAILTRFFDNTFEESTSFTIGIDFRHVTYQLEDGTVIIACVLQKVRLCVWDTAGQERFRQLAPSYIRDAHVILIVFDLTAPNIVEQIIRWMLFVEGEREEGAQVIFVGNKCDLKQRKHDPSITMRMMAEYKTPYVETSAKTGFNVKEVRCRL